MTQWILDQVQNDRSPPGCFWIKFRMTDLGVGARFIDPTARYLLLRVLKAKCNPVEDLRIAGGSKRGAPYF